MAASQDIQEVTFTAAGGDVGWFCGDNEESSLSTARH